MREIRTILNVPFDVLQFSEALEKMNQACLEKKKLFIVTPNPEMCLLAKKDSHFLDILKRADLSIPDGFGILWADRYLSGKKSFLRLVLTLLTPKKTNEQFSFKERITGTDLMQGFCHEFPEKKIFLLGAKESVNKRLKNKLLEAGVRVVGNLSGNPSLTQEKMIREAINHSKAEVLFVAFGAPEQEAWIFRNLPSLPDIKVAMGVGGAFDFLSGAILRAPLWIQKWGLEWLFRLILEPKRIKRIFNATIKFPFSVYRS